MSSGQHPTTSERGDYQKMRRLASCGSARALLHPSSILRSRPRPFAQRPFHPFVSLWSILRLWSLLCLRPLLWHNFCEHQHPMRERIVKFLRFCFLPHSGIGRLSFAFLPTLCLGMLGVLCYPFIRDHVSPSPALAFIALLVLALVWALLMQLPGGCTMSILGWLSPLVFVPLVPLILVLLTGTGGINKMRVRESGSQKARA